MLPKTRADGAEFLADLEDLAVRGFERALGLGGRGAGREVEVATSTSRRAKQHVAHDAADQEQLGLLVDAHKRVGQAHTQLLDVVRQFCHARARIGSLQRAQIELRRHLRVVAGNFSLQ